MAPRKPAKKTPAKAQKASAKPAVKKASAVASAPMAEGCCSSTAQTCSTSGSSCCFQFCPLGKRLVTRSFWASAVIAFLVIFATDWFVHGHLLMADYLATSALWRAEADMRHSLLITGQALTAMVYAVVVLGMGYATRWWGAMVSGVLAASPVAISSAMSYAVMPFATSHIPTVWAIAALIQGGLVGLTICAMLKAARAPEGSSCGCGPSCGCHNG